MRKIHFYTIAMAILLLLANKAWSQENDLGGWAEFELKKEIKDWSFSVGEEVRTMDNMTSLYGLYTSMAVDYKPWKHLEFGTSYQFILFNDTEYDDLQSRHRLNFATTGDVKWNRFKFSLRERFQMTFKDESVHDYKMNPKNKWRNRFEMEYNIPKSKITPSFSVETHYQLNNPDGNKFDKLRYKLAAAYKINKNNKLQLYTQFDHEINVNNPVDRTVIGFSYSLELKDKKDKK